MNLKKEYFSGLIILNDKRVKDRNFIPDKTLSGSPFPKNCSMLKLIRYAIFICQVIVISSLTKVAILKVGLEDARDVSLLLSANQ